MKKLVLKYLSYILLKFIIFYGVTLIYDKVKIVNTGFSALVFGLLILSILPILESVFLGIPTVWILIKSKTNSYWLLLLSLVFGFELLLTIGVTQNKLMPYHLCKLALSIIMFIVLFRNYLPFRLDRKM